jgi:DNA-binding transcriptional MerR regulator
MARNTLNEKRYYSISEVARMTELEPYVLRYWEKEFPLLRPSKNRGGSRQYTVKDIELINKIKHLRTEEKLTIAGARTRLMMRKGAEQKEKLADRARFNRLISQIRKEIEDLMAYFS